MAITLRLSFSLQTAYRSIVAPDSIRAMTIRLVVWGIILGLMFAQSRKQQDHACIKSFDLA